MHDCVSFEIMIEKRLHGALGVSESTDLSRHVSSCSNCSRFEEFARTSGMLLAGSSQIYREALDLDHLRERVAKRVHFYRSIPRLTFVVAIIVAAVVGMFFGPWFALIDLAVSVPIVVIVTSFCSQRGKRVDHPKGDPLLALRKDYEKNIRLVRRISPWGFALGAILVADTIDSLFDPQKVVLLVVAQLFFLVGMVLSLAHSRFIGLPILVAELEDLTQDEGQS